jgi:hypothetical protein
MTTLRTSAIALLVSLLVALPVRAEALGNSTCNAGAGTLSQDIYAAYLADTSRNGFSPSMTSTQQAMICSQVWAFVQFMATLPTPITPPVLIGSVAPYTAGTGLGLGLRGYDLGIEGQGQTFAGTFTPNASLHIAGQDTSSGRLTQITTTGTSIPALNLMADTDGTGTNRWWAWGVHGGNFDIFPSTAFGSPDMFTLSSTGYLQIVGAGQNTTSYNTSTGSGGAIIAADTGGSVNSGGGLILAAGSGNWQFAMIKGGATNGGGNTVGDISFETRINSTDATLTETWRMINNGQLLSTGMAFASLGTPANGTIVYCNNCTIANPCAGAGTGALAKRLNGVWVCN